MAVAAGRCAPWCASIYLPSMTTIRRCPSWCSWNSLAWARSAGAWMLSSRKSSPATVSKGNRMNGLFRFPRTAWRWPALALALLLAAPQALAAQLLDRIVAVVNDDVVLLSELEQEVKTVAAQLQQRNIPLPDQQILIRQVLERLIMQRLQLAVAERSGIRVDEATLNAAVQRIAEQNNLSLSQFRAALEAEGYDYAAFREGLRNEIVLARLHQRQAESRVHITPQEIDEFLASQSGSNTDEYLVGHILISIPDQA